MVRQYSEERQQELSLPLPQLTVHETTTGFKKVSNFNKTNYQILQLYTCCTYACM